MEFYDSPDTEEESKCFAKKINAVHDFFKNMSRDEIQDYFNNITQTLEMMAVEIEDWQAKEKNGPLDKQDKKFVRKLKKEMKEKAQKFEDTLLLLGHSLIMKANDYMFMLKQEAAKGNPEAKKAYEQLYPGYRAALHEQASDPELMN